MPWETRGKRKYFYRSVRDGTKVKRVYYGVGPLANLAAACDAEIKDVLAATRTDEASREILGALMIHHHARCVLLASATLLAAGFHRPARHSWRIWYHGRRHLARDR